MIHNIYHAETEKDEEKLLTFYSFPVEHWQHIRSTNIIESIFSTVRLRTKKTRGQGTMDMTLAMVFKLTERASKRCRRLRGYKHIGKVTQGVNFKYGIERKKAA